MRSLFRVFTLMSLAMLSLPVFAQEGTSAPVQQSGLGLAVLLAGILVVFVVGLVMSRRESQGDEDDLV